MAQNGRSWNGTADNYRYSFNGKEDDKNSGWQTQDYGFRSYDYRICRFFSQDPLFRKYPWYTPYQFAGNKPIRYIDLDGLEEGTPFNTPGDAAGNFANIYGKMSIQENREFSTAIYKYTDKDGSTKYTYTSPSRGGKAGAPNVTPSHKEGKMEAGMHSHGASSEKYENNVFSPDDKQLSKSNSTPEYLSTPKGEVKVFDPAAPTEDGKVVSKNAPSDPNDPEVIDKTNGVIKEGTTKKERREERKQATQENRKTRAEYKEKYKQIVNERLKSAKQKAAS